MFDRNFVKSAGWGAFLPYMTTTFEFRRGLAWLFAASAIA